MKLEIGGTYLTRDELRTVVVTSTTAATFYPYLGNDGNSYTAEGKYWYDREDGKDLVERIDVPSMQEDAAPLPTSEEAVAVGWSGRFTAEDVEQVWNTYTALLMGVGKYVSMEDLIAERNVLLKELE